MYTCTYREKRERKKRGGEKRTRTRRKRRKKGWNWRHCVQAVPRGGETKTLKQVQGDGGLESWRSRKPYAGGLPNP